MARAKLILICQSGGEFLTNDDGSLTYAGGEANAVNVNSEAVFDDLKLKLAEMCNLDYKTVSVKYFLPGNKRTLINLSNDKDLKRMLDFQKNSVTADVFVTGVEGFDRSVLNKPVSRGTGIKLAETVNHNVARAASSAANAVKKTKAASSAANAVKKTKAASSPANAVKKTKPVGLNVAPLTSIPADSVATATTRAPFDATPTAVSSPSRETDDSMDSHASAGTDDSNSDPQYKVATSPIDMTDTPADTVKKRRRTASWKIGANGPTIVSVADDASEKRSRKKVQRNHGTPAEADHTDLKLETVPIEYDLDTPIISDDASLEKLVASWKDGITGIGQDFKSVYEFRDALQKYSIAHRFAYKLKKNDSTRASGRCAAEDCSWKIHASWVPADESFRIKKFDNSHTCGGESWKSAHPAKNWLVGIIKEKLRDSPHHKPKEIANTISRDFGIELSYTQVWRGIEDAREQLQGSYKESYNQLPLFCKNVVESNPGSFSKLDTNDDKLFQRFFISFFASVHGFQNYCRPLLFLEASSLKSKYQETLLTATAVDGDDCFFPLAFAIVDVENDYNWHWFLDQLKSAIPTSESITFLSDIEKGLKDSVLKVFENARFGYSMYHLMESFNKNLKGPFLGDGKGSLLGNFVGAAHALRLDGFKKFTEQIKRVSSQAYDWVMQIEPEYWATTSLKGERFNQITINVGEPYYKLMDEVRELPIVLKIEALITMMIELINTRRTDSSKWSAKLTPSKEEKLQEEMRKARGLKVFVSNETLFEVHDESNHVVNLVNKDCTCLSWKFTGLPCRHAIAVFNYTKRSVYDYCSSYFTADIYRALYSESIHPVPCNGKSLEKEDEASETAIVLPPCPPKSPPGEPKLKREKSPDPNKRSVICSRCKETGHNKRKCKATLTS